ncbi:Ubiquitin family protein [Mycena kentingensis (nom. inval.)]|nr:Ubiquitin family protein [Mycena kentingensis (nom. inval.)]
MPAIPGLVYIRFEEKIKLVPATKMRQPYHNVENYVQTQFPDARGRNLEIRVDLGGIQDSDVVVSPDAWSQFVAAQSSGAVPEMGTFTVTIAQTAAAAGETGPSRIAGDAETAEIDFPVPVGAKARATLTLLGTRTPKPLTALHYLKPETLQSEDPGFVPRYSRPVKLDLKTVTDATEMDGVILRSHINDSLEVVGIQGFNKRFDFEMGFDLLDERTRLKARDFFTFSNALYPEDLPKEKEVETPVAGPSHSKPRSKPPSSAKKSTSRVIVPAPASPVFRNDDDEDAMEVVEEESVLHQATQIGEDN